MSDPTPLGETLGAFLSTLAANVVSSERTGRELKPEHISPMEVKLAEALHRIELYPEQQHTIGQYAADFYFPDHRVCVEVDGRAHMGRLERDHRRDLALRGKGIRTLRIPGAHVRTNADAVAERIKIYLDRVEISRLDGGE